MSNTLRGASLVATCAVIAAMVWPSAAPVAGDVIFSNLQPQAISLNVPQPSEQGLPFSPVRIENELDDDQTPRVSLLVATESDAIHAAPLDLEGLVDDVADMNRADLEGDMLCLTSAIYYEARGESIEGQLAVAQVVLNRTEQDRWPDDVCGVVYQSGQFSFTFDGRPDVPAVKGPAWRRAEALAIIAAGEGWQDVTDRATFFHATYVNPRWRHVKEQTRRIGAHIFYR